jgi:hypothetical protein
MITKLFTNESDYPLVNAQRNLMGRTHYVDPDTLRFHKSKVLACKITDNGLLCAIVTSDSMDYQNTKRGFRYAIFDIFGTCLGRPDLADSYKTKAQATKAMWDAVNAIDAKAVTLAAIACQRGWLTAELERLQGTVDAMEDRPAIAA